MTKREIPRDADGRRLCEYCLEAPVPPSLGTKPRRYCSASHRQMAYAARQRLALVRESIARGVEIGRRVAHPTPGTSTDIPTIPATSTDVPGDRQVTPPIPEAPAPRRNSRRRSGMTADPMSLWQEDGDQD